MKRKIMILTSVWRPEFLCKITDGIYKRIEKENYDLYIFNAYDVRGNGNSSMQEYRIYKLPDIEDFDGVIVAINAVGTERVIQEISEKCKVANKPIFSIDSRFEGACFAGIDNYASMYQMVEHLITVHECKIFNYLGGPENNAENQQRYQAFCDCLQAHQLKVVPERVSHRSFLQTDGWRAYDAWKAQGLHLPDAVVCANDEMALGYVVASNKDGFSAPRDYRLTGFDNLEDAQKNFPSISSVQRNWEELGYLCADALIKANHDGQKPEEIIIPGGCVLNESCGCVAEEERDVYSAYVQIYQEKKIREKEEDELRTIRQHLCECDNEKELRERLVESCERLKVSEIAVAVGQVLHDGERFQEYPYRMEMIFEGVSEEIDIRKQLIPTKWTQEQEPQIYYFGALYCGKNPSGYCVTHFEPHFLEGRMHKTFIESIGLSLDSILRRRELNESNIKLGQLYIQDSLTGLYNRFGYKKKGTDFFEEQNGMVYMAFLDVDGLKSINDLYGHAVGDLAICGVSEAMKAVFHQGQVLVRMGGDEFLVIGALAEGVSFEEKERQIAEFLEKYSKENNLPLVLQASIGFIRNTAEDSMEVLVQKADHQMYNIKQMKKKYEFTYRSICDMVEKVLRTGAWRNVLQTIKTSAAAGSRKRGNNG